MELVAEKKVVDIFVYFEKSMLSFFLISVLQNLFIFPELYYDASSETLKMLDYSSKTIICSQRFLSDFSDIFLAFFQKCIFLRQCALQVTQAETRLTVYRLRRVMTRRVEVASFSKSKTDARSDL